MDSTRLGDHRRVTLTVNRTALLVLVAAACANPNSRESAQTGDNSTMSNRKGAVKSVHYSRSFGPFGSELAQFNRGGRSVVHLSHNYDRQPEIGHWNGSVTDAHFDELVRRLRASHYNEIEVPRLQYPGEYSLSIGEHREGEDRPMFKSCSLDAPELEPVLEWITQLTAEVRQRPVRVLRGQASWGAPEARFEGPFDVRVTLENIGVEPFRLTHPGDPEQTMPAATLFFNNEDGAQRGFLEMGARRVIDALPPATASDVVLAPGERLTFTARGVVPVEADQYWGSLVLRASGDHSDASALSGQLTLELGPVIVR